MTIPPNIQIKYENLGSNEKTVLINIDDISVVLNRPVETLIDVFKCRGFKVVNWYDKYLIDGHISTKKLQDILDKYIFDFVLCKQCGEPLQVALKRKFELICHSCNPPKKNNPYDYKID